jgi:hypothetical protein
MLARLQTQNLHYLYLATLLSGAPYNLLQRHAAAIGMTNRLAVTRSVIVSFW